MTEATITGTVKWFNSEKGFGFLTSDRGDLFVHVSQLPTGRTSLEPGTTVRCGVQQGRRGLEAVKVEVVSEPPKGGPARPAAAPARPATSSPRLAAPAPTSPRPAAGPRPAPGAGQAGTIKLTLIGRPSDIRPLGEDATTAPCFAMVLETDPAKQPTLPKGLPPASGSTAYLVLIAGRQWRQVADNIASDLEDRLVVEGYGGIDPQAPKMITVWATGVTTTARQRAARLAGESAAEEAASQEGAGQE
jgi:cold shock CspA family protein